MSFVQPVFADNPVLLVALGDSLTAGYQLPSSQSFAAQLETALKRDGYNVTVFNAGISGDTTLGGLNRIQTLIDKNPQAMIIELGANDAFRGVPPEQVEANLSQMIEKAQKAHIRVLLAGMVSPLSMGQEYVKAFNGIYPRLSQKYQVPLYPFFMDGVMNYGTGEAYSELLLADRVHPNEKGVKEIVRRILPRVKDLVKPFVLK